MSHFTGKNILITGASGGIGASLCKLLLKKEAFVWGVDKNKDALGSLEKEMKNFNLPFHAIEADITNIEKLKAVRDKIISTRKTIDIWINNAGVSGLGDFTEQSIEDFNRVIQINFMALVNGTRLALETMEKVGSGTIVNLASVTGHIAAPYLVAYSASKHAVVGFTRALQEELSLKLSPVHLLLASPGFVDTPIIEKENPTGFPEWLDFALGSPEGTAKEIVRAIEERKTEIFPTINGKIIMNTAKIFPNMVRKSSRLLLAKNIKDLFLFKRTPPKRIRTDI